MNFASLAEWLSWQETLHPSEMELGLDRVKRVAERLDFYPALLSAEKKFHTVIVGGTNGKGSCVAYLESILIAAGYRVGAYSSPHLLKYNERVRINGVMVDDQRLCDSFTRIDAARKQGAEPVSLTYFEFGTLAALDIFYQHPVDIQILEVGLGGRLDAVNIIDADVAVVVNVAMDHEAWLGNTRELIGAEKAGIFRAGIPLIIGEASPLNPYWQLRKLWIENGCVLPGRIFPSLFVATAGNLPGAIPSKEPTTGQVYPRGAYLCPVRPAPCKCWQKWNGRPGTL